jgi:hypothetical protein
VQQRKAEQLKELQSNEMLSPDPENSAVKISAGLNAAVYQKTGGLKGQKIRFVFMFHYLSSIPG